MTPSKEAIEEYWNCIALQGATADGVSKAIEAAYTIDVASLEQRVKELEAALDKLWCISCHNTGWIDSDGCCGNCDHGRRQNRIRELEAENQRLKKELDGLTKCIFCGGLFHLGDVHICPKETPMKAQLEGKDG